jgi:hypothetical protein
MLKLTFFQLELNPGVWSWCGVGAPPNITPLFLYSIQARRQTLSHFMSRQRGFFSHRSRKKLRLNETSDNILFILLQQHSFDALRHVCSLVWSFFSFDFFVMLRLFGSALTAGFGVMCTLSVCPPFGGPARRVLFMQC